MLIRNHVCPSTLFFPAKPVCRNVGRVGPDIPLKNFILILTSSSALTISYLSLSLSLCLGPSWAGSCLGACARTPDCARLLFVRASVCVGPSDLLIQALFNTTLNPPLKPFREIILKTLKKKIYICLSLKIRR